ISGATASTLTLGQAQVGKTITVQAAYTDQQGSAESVTSLATANVVNFNDAPTGVVTITGIATQNELLTVSNNLADVDGLGTIAYQWLADGEVMSGATTETLLLTQAHVGKNISVQASYIDQQGTTENVISASTGYIVNVNELPTGGVTISGIATQNQTLTAINTLADTDGLGVINYQWFADGIVIGGATHSTLILAHAQVDKSISVKTSYIDQQGTSESAMSLATRAVTNVNDLPTGTVTITGTVAQNQTLTVSNTLADADGLGAISYQWLANGVIIDDAINSTFTLSQDQVGKAIKVQAKYTDSYGTAEVVSSLPTPPVVNVNDIPTGTVNITGTARQNQTLTANHSLADIDGLGSLSYQWLADGVLIDGGTGNSLTLTQAQVGKAVSVQAGYIDQQGTTENVISSATATVNNVNDAPTGMVFISGIPTQNKTLTASNNIADVDGLGTINYQWFANGVAINGATTGSLTLTQAQVGNVITAQANYIDGLGAHESISSAATSTIVNINDAPTGTLVINGIPAQNQTLTASNNLVDADGLGVISYQWLANGVIIDDAINSTFTLSQDQVGKAIKVQAKYTDDYGTAEMVSSLPTTPVVNVNDIPTGTVNITGIARQNQTLTANHSLADIDGLGSLSYQWLADGVLIDGGTGNSLTLTQAQVGKAVSVQAGYIDQQGTTENVISSATATVNNVNDAPTGMVFISGIPTQNKTLTASNNIADVDGLGTINYQWFANGVAINGATTGSLTLTQAQVGNVITAQANYIDGLGTHESISSAATATIVNINDAPTGTLVINGTPAQNQTLTASNTLADVDGLGTIAYQWLADGTVITGATASTLILAQAQVGKAISVQASYTDGYGSNENLTSSATAFVEMIQNGVVQDGYLSNALVWVDTNDNGQRDWADSNNNGHWDSGEGESWTLTDSTGQFSELTGTGNLRITANPNGVTTDISTGAVFTGSYSALSGSSVINPLTTLIVAAGGNQELVKAALGLDASLNLNTYDPLAAALAAGTDAIAAALAIKVQSAAIQIANVIAVIASVTKADGASAGTITSVAQSVAATLMASANTSPSGTINLADSTLLESAINKALSSVFTDTTKLEKLSILANTTATAVALVNSKIEISSATASNNAQNGGTVDAISTLKEIVSAQIVAQQTIAQQAANGVLNPDATITVNTSNVDAQITNASADVKQLFVNTGTNIAPTLTAFTSPVATGNENSQIAVTFANLQAQGNDADVDGTVTAFVVKTVSAGILNIGSSAGTALAWATGTNDTVDTTHQAYWSPLANTSGNMDAFTVVAKDDSGLLSATATQAKVAVYATEILGNAPLQISKANPNAWINAWSSADINISQKADVSNSAENWSSISLNGLAGNILAGGDLYTGDLGVSGQTAATSKVLQEIDGTEALRFNLNYLANEASASLSRLFYHDDNTLGQNEAGRLQAYNANNLVGELVFSGDKANGQQLIVMNVSQGFNSLVFTAGAYDNQHNFVSGAYLNDANQFATAPYATNTVQHGSDYLIDTLLIGVKPQDSFL
ncbi:MAG: hypothetical protein WCS87_13705, partial [Methylococcaceae bacterium]